MIINGYSPQYNIRKAPVSANRKCSIERKVPSFCGHAKNEQIVKKGLNFLIQQTAFFREPETNNCVRNYIFDNFGNDKSIKILSGGCSTGEEAVTLSMLFYPLKDKVQITGIDLGKKAIEQAKSRRYTLEGVEDESRILDHFKDIENSPFSDNYLLFGRKGLKAQEQHFKSLFNEFFEPIGKETKTPLWKKVIYDIIENSCKIKPLKKERRTFKLKDGMAENCRFIQGDIRDVDKLTNDDKFNAIYFRNAMYHLTVEDVKAFERTPKKDSENIVEELISKFKAKLKPKGLIVFGENEAVQMSDSTTVPKVMKKLGFIPLNETKEHQANIWVLADKK